MFIILRSEFLEKMDCWNFDNNCCVRNCGCSFFLFSKSIKETRIDIQGGGRLSKKFKMITAIILILIVLVGSKILYNREISKKAIYDYIAKQGIKENQLKYTAFHRDFTMGGYFLATYVEGEKFDIYYMYTFRGWDKKVLFQAYYEGSEHIKAQQWGGSGLSGTERKKLKYPPLNE